MKIGHITPCYTPIAPGQVAQLLREQDVLTGRLEYDYRWWGESYTDIKRLRNRTMETAIRWELDYLVMQDADVWSKSNIGAIAPMLDTLRSVEATMVSAIVGRRRKPHVANAEPCRAGEVYVAEKCGTGLVLIDVQKVASWKFSGAWFDQTYNTRGSAIETGEDIFFSKLVRKMDGEEALWIDGRVPTTHALEDTSTLDYPGATAGVTRDATAA